MSLLASHVDTQTYSQCLCQGVTSSSVCLCQGFWSASGHLTVPQQQVTRHTHGLPPSYSLSCEVLFPNCVGKHSFLICALCRGNPGFPYCVDFFT